MVTSVATAMPRTPVFNAVSIGLFLLSVVGFVLVLATPPGPQDMMVPWLRTVGLLQAVVGATCVALIWFRQGWAFFLYVGLFLFDALLGLSMGRSLPLMLVGPALLVLYLWALHSGGAGSMWRQMFGGAGAGRAGMAYGMTPAMPPPLPGTGHPVAPAPMPPPVKATATTVARPAGMDPLEALKRLGALRDSGAITPQEFSLKKAELLERLAEYP